VLRVLVGSGVHGTSIEGQDDEDLMGVAIEPIDWCAGLRKFEHYIWRTKPEGVRSGPGDTDLAVYSLRKWFKLALDGNPTVLLLMFSPELRVSRAYFGNKIRQETPGMVASKEAGKRFLGYMTAQKKKLTGERSSHTNRPELIAAHGYDTKFAMHCLRLGYQGIEYMKTGRLTLPIQDPYLRILREVRTGQWKLDDVIAMYDRLVSGLELAMIGSPLPDHPDREVANKWLVDIYQQYWDEHR
jgi:predicted nucleotidyltransferase